MKTIVIQTPSSEEYKFISTLLKRMGFNGRTKTLESLEDETLLQWMSHDDLSKTVAEEKVMKKLRS